jgi:hypothetical protein
MYTPGAQCPRFFLGQAQMEKTDSFTSDVEALLLPYEKLVTILPNYEAELKKLHDYLERVDSAAGQRLFIVLKENAVMMSRAFRYAAIMESLEDKYRVHQEAIESRFYRQYNEGYSRKLTPTDIKVYLNGEVEYQAVKEMMNHIVWYKRQFKGMVETIKTLGFALKSMTDLRINSLEYDMID